MQPLLLFTEMIMCFGNDKKKFHNGLVFGLINDFKIGKKSQSAFI